MLLKIKVLRKNKKLSQQELADKIEVSVRMLSEYEGETTDIPFKKLQKIADVLDVSIHDLIVEKSPIQYRVDNDFNKVADVDSAYLKSLVDIQQEFIVEYKKKIATLERKLQDRPGKANAS